MIARQFFAQPHSRLKDPDVIRLRRMCEKERMLVDATDAAYESDDYDKAARLEDAQVRLRCAMPLRT